MSESANETIDQIFITLALSNMPLRVITYSTFKNAEIYLHRGIKNNIKKKPLILHHN